ncbi:MAG: hypothetical protein ACR2RB_11630 [Gammaproteobacteria bacterium]
MTPGQRQTLYAVCAGVSLAITVYSVFGVLQAALLFNDERALSNYYFWVPAALIFGVLSVVFLLLILRQAQQESGGRR